MVKSVNIVEISGELFRDLKNGEEIGRYSGEIRRYSEDIMRIVEKFGKLIDYR